MNLGLTICLIFFALCGITRNILNLFFDKDENDNFINKKIDNLFFIVNLIFLISIIGSTIFIFLIQ